MTYRAKMKDGEVVFEGGIKPANGVDLRVEAVDAIERKEESAATTGMTVGQRMLDFAGLMDDPSFSTDGAENHDHYIYGAPKK